jgi:hypothetical protein
MEPNGRTSFVTALAERGLTLNSFDGHTLKLNYNAAADHQIEQGKAISGDELTFYAQRLLEGEPEATRMFPRLERIEVDFGQI